MVDQPESRQALVVEVDGSVADRAAVVTIREFGLCLGPEQAEAGLDHALSLTLIEAMTDRLDLHRHAEGRTFTLRRRLHGAPPGRTSSPTAGRTAAGRAASLY